MTGTFYSSDERRAIDSFRKMVSQWLDENANVPRDIPLPRRGNPLPEPLQEWTVQFRKNLGEKGWLAPNWPAQYGGGGLSVHHASIIQEELGRRRLPPLHGSTMAMMALRVYGTETQKMTLLASVLRGEKTLVHMFTEADRGTDIRSIGTVALKTDRGYVLNGQKDYITSQLTPDLALCLAVTDQAISTDDRFSIVAVDTTGSDVLIRPSNLLTPGAEQTIYMTDVTSPLDHLIGEEGQGLEIANMMLDIERGGIGVPLELQREIEWKEKQAHDNIQN